MDFGVKPRQSSDTYTLGQCVYYLKAKKSLTVSEPGGNNSQRTAAPLRPPETIVVFSAAFLTFPLFQCLPNLWPFSVFSLC